jgi:hypothetical protein
MGRSFCQGSFKQLQTDEKNIAKNNSDAIRTFIQREDEEFAHARKNMRYLNSSRCASNVIFNIISLSSQTGSAKPTTARPSQTLHTHSA